MDPLDIMMNLEQVIPYYQPIVSADTREVIGYEVKAYYQEGEGERQRLDWFFKDPSIPHDFQLEVNSKIQQKALDDFLTADSSSSLLFINYDARLLFKDDGETLLTLLQSYEEKGLNLSRIVIELKEEHITDEMESLDTLFKYMKTLGIQIALDDVGKTNGNLGQMALFEPNIVKIDVSFLKDDALPHLYRDVHYSISMLARKIGATLLFKGISTYNQFNYAWRNGGRYYQGRYLGQSQQEFAEEDSCKEKIERDFQLFVQFEKKKMKAQLELASRINKQFDETLPNIKSDAPFDEIIFTVGHACSQFAFRVYICNDEGIQLSSNAEKNKDGDWELHYEGRLKNWSWRPYFFENIVRMNVEKKGILSDLYTDIERDEQIRTYSYPLSEKSYIFIDIPYDYLYEQEGLL
ncbi:EAL domain-containing protein [Oceanobacillus halophilus]|uniref:EAL domain-containing protein n=1 Tax=Oceanobacillus halophilus TaxID=930130 RepID=A0A495A9M9_9BACI|nr:EAL-associated domain-containing protein [Oceanobacillus halophilus]RKQ35915.1 EAL domain-containing protein [Oceanobacillus halophilus]